MASIFRVLNCPTGTWTADVFASTDLSTATDTGVSLSQSAAGIVTGSVSRTGLHMVRLFRNAVRYGETWGNLVDGATVDCDESKMLAAAGLASYLPVTTTRMDIASAGLVRFVTDNTGETSAAAGSVAKLAQGGASAVTVYPLQTTINDRVQATTIQAYVGEAGYAIGPNAVVDGNGDPVDLTVATTLRFIVTDQYGAGLLDTTSVTISGAGNNYWTVTGTSATTLTAPASHEWSLRDVVGTSVNVVYGLGKLTVTPAANVSA